MAAEINPEGFQFGEIVDSKVVKSKVAIIVQARLTSKRFPNKVLSKLAGKPVLQHVLDKISKLEIPIIVAIPDTPQNDALEQWLINYFQSTGKLSWIFRGTENDVLARFYQCATLRGLEDIIRVCGDTPLIDPDDILENYSKYKLNHKKRMIYGNGSWVFSYEMLQEAFETQGHAESREHVVRSMFNSIDYPDDIQRLENLLQ